MNTLMESEALETGKRLEGLPMERDKGKPEGLREWDPADPFAAGRAPRRRAPIDRAGPLPMRERSIDGGPPWPDLNHESGLFLHKHGKRGSFGRARLGWRRAQRFGGGRPRS